MAVKRINCFCLGWTPSSRAAKENSQILKKQNKQTKKSHGWSFPLFWPEDVRNSFLSSSRREDVTRSNTLTSSIFTAWRALNLSNLQQILPRDDLQHSNLKKTAHAPACSQSPASVWQTSRTAFHLPVLLTSWEPVGLSGGLSAFISMSGLDFSTYHFLSSHQLFTWLMHARACCNNLMQPPWSHTHTHALSPHLWTIDLTW